MPVRRDTRRGQWFFRAVVKYPDGRRERIWGRPGAPGRFADLPNSKVGALEAERRAIALALTGKPIDVPPPREEDQTRRVPTVEEYAATFLRTHRPNQKPSSRRSKEGIVKSCLLPHFGHLRLDEIRQEHVDEFARATLERCTAKTVNNRLSVLSSLIKYAAANRVIAKPTLRLKIEAMAPELVAVSMNDVDRLVEAAEPLYRAAVLLAAEAGLRAGELRGAQWTDARKGQLHVRRALDTATGEVIPPKHNKARIVSLSERVLAALETLPRRGIWILSKPDGRPLQHGQDLYCPIVALYRRAGVALPPAPLHSLRHTFGTTLAAEGVPLPVIQELMGHASIETTRRYIHVGEEQKREAIAGAFNARGSQVAAAVRVRRS